MRTACVLAGGVFLGALILPAAADDLRMTIVLKNHLFAPAELHVPANTRIVLEVDNQDPTPEEFESGELKVEKIVAGGTKGIVRFGPLAPGSYPFYGEFNQDTAKGTVVAK